MRRIFVVGCPRSGTTIVQAMLAALPGVMSLGETNFFLRLLRDFDGWLHNKPDTHQKWQKRLWLPRRHTHMLLQSSMNAAFSESVDAPKLHWHSTGFGYVKAFRRLLDEMAEKKGDICWVEKTPDHLAYIGLIFELLPDAHFIHVMRNGEDVIASAIEAQCIYMHHRQFLGGIPHWVARWNRAMDTHMEYAEDVRHTIIPYECLFTAPKKIQAYLGNLVGANSAKVDVGNVGHLADLRSEPWKHAAVDATLKPPQRKFEYIFGPDIQSWIKAQLTDYADVVECVASKQYRLPWINSASTDLSADHQTKNTS